MKALAVTGHRPEKILRFSRDDLLLRDLTQFAFDILEDRLPQLVITGMCRGWDMAVARACATLDIPFIAAVPFKGQERLWSGKDQIEYRDLLDRAEQVEIVCNHSLNIAYTIRDEWMVDRAESVLALFNGTPGGTANTIRYAEGWCKPVENVWSAWDRVWGSGRGAA